MRKRNAVRAAAAALAAMMALTACGGGGGNETTAAAGGDTGSTAAGGDAGSFRLRRGWKDRYHRCHGRRYRDSGPGWTAGYDHGQS